jgi:NAD(P)-dependent dehydrogenase (short-subunit alcohol dehydrogenase family)
MSLASQLSRDDQWPAFLSPAAPMGSVRAAARSLLDDGHEVVLHARSTERASTLADLASQAAGVVVGDLRSAAEIHRVAEQVNAIGRMNAVIHNAGIYMAPRRGSTPEGHAGILAVNTLAPFMLTALIERPDRLVYLSSGLHRMIGRLPNWSRGTPRQATPAAKNQAMGRHCPERQRRSNPQFTCEGLDCFAGLSSGRPLWAGPVGSQ